MNITHPPDSVEYAIGVLEKPNFYCSHNGTVMEMYNN